VTPFWPRGRSGVRPQRKAALRIQIKGLNATCDSDPSHNARPFRARRGAAGSGPGRSATSALAVLVARQSSSAALTCPVVGSRNRRPERSRPSKSSNPFSEPAMASVEPLPMRGSPQLSSMKRITED
jgi:hypothetical protein